MQHDVAAEHDIGRAVTLEKALEPGLEVHEPLRPVLLRRTRDSATPSNTRACVSSCQACFSSTLENGSPRERSL
jgi:hypothetical protein